MKHFVQSIGALAILGTGLFAAIPAADAALVSFVPGDKPVPVSPAFGPLVPGGDLADKYVDFGVDFTYGGIEGIFDDGGPLAFGGVNAFGDVDLVSPVDGQIVLEGTTTAATTDYFYAEAGFADDATLTLTLFDSSFAILATILNGPPLGTFGRTTFEYVGAGIAYFSITGADTFGVDEIRLNTPTVSTVPLPAALPLLLTAVMGFAGLQLRRKKT